MKHSPSGEHRNSIPTSLWKKTDTEIHGRPRMCERQLYSWLRRPGKGWTSHHTLFLVARLREEARSCQYLLTTWMTLKGLFRQKKPHTYSVWLHSGKARKQVKIKLWRWLITASQGAGEWLERIKLSFQSDRSIDLGSVIQAQIFRKFLNSHSRSVQFTM